jgi:hypothetical protein
VTSRLSRSRRRQRRQAAEAVDLLIFLESALLALVGFIILLMPSFATTIIGIGAGLGGLLITFVGIRSRAIERE